MADAIRYDDKNVHRLMDEVAGIRTFEQVADWDKRAQEEIEKIAEVLEKLEVFVRDRERELEAEAEARRQKSVVARLFHSRSKEKELTASIADARQHLAGLEAHADTLQERIDFTPNDKAEQKALIKELKQEKKELQARKKEVAAEMRDIRVEARQRSANISSNSLGIKMFRGLAASERRSVRTTKERALRPHESEKASIERQIINIDRRIMWLEKFDQ